MSDNATPPSRRRWGTIPEALDRSRMGRSKLYAAAASNPGLFRKWGAKTLVDFDMLDAIMDQLPAAVIKPPVPQRRGEVA